MSTVRLSQDPITDGAYITKLGEAGFKGLRTTTEVLEELDHKGNEGHIALLDLHAAFIDASLAIRKILLGIAQLEEPVMYALTVELSVHWQVEVLAH